MIHLGKSTKDSPSKVIEKAASYFGPNGVGLQIASRDECSVYLVGSGGHVQVVASTKDGQTRSETTDVDIQSREWEKQAQAFLREI